MKTIIGIDLGTSTTEAAVVKDGKPVMVLNFNNSPVIPSAVGLDETGNYIIGEMAKAQFLLEPERTVIEVKRKMGSDETVSLGKETHTPVEVSSMILSYVKRYASVYLQEEVESVVLSIPAYFNDLQRKATLEAGRLAGLNVERLIHEPTAAALSYGVDHLEEEGHVLVYDLGGGTFDVTLLELFGGVLEVKASSGDNQLGGKDFDELLMGLLSERFHLTHGVRLDKDVYAMAKLKDEVEKCKVALSAQDSYHVAIPFLYEKDGKPLAMEETVTREQFEDLIRECVDRTHDPIESVLADAGLRPNELDLVLLVGGSTKIPLIKKDLSEFLGIEPSEAVHPDYAVAEGAAIQAGILSGAIDKKDGIVMTDVNPFSLGIRALTYWEDQHMSVIIPRNTTIPVTKSEVYHTSFDNQTEAEINVYQGEYQTTSRNQFLGKFTIEGIPPRKAGEERIQVRFSYNQNGMLAVTAKIHSTGKEANIQINLMEERDSLEERVDVSEWKNFPNAKPYRTLIRRAEKILNSSQNGGDETMRELEYLTYLLKKAILEDGEDVRDIEEELFDLLDDITG